ncbi:protein adenylyltransferase SelO-like [Megalops cyprinoides]|uniref:protein adenylyltransferase SelO-like n=1 Tax=Megalops cyprinoides TaxID=118141 RepID=UPI001864B028|nr:protein adenylyltransferase SelO-like [Megalops cyprinoides]
MTRRSCCSVCAFFLVVSSLSLLTAVGFEFCENGGDCFDSNSQLLSSFKRSNYAGAGRKLVSSLDSFTLSCRKLIDAFPLDEVRDNFVRGVKNCIFSVSEPTPLKGRLRVAAVSKEVLEELLDLNVSVSQTADFVHYFSGGKLWRGSIPLAHRYGGHQFGIWAGQLGDGRAHLLGEYTNRNGERWELQLKGSGKTPYSRSGDGRAVLRSSVREFLCSEAMHFLGVPTSRAASIILSEEPVWRDQFYNGNVKKERGAVVLRLAKSWFRIGSLEILSKAGELDLLRKLLDYVIEEHFPSVKPSEPDKYLVFYAKVVAETAQLISQWMSVGFAHGVCNTDNFSLLSVTIDYGPFGFMESYNPNFVPNTSDEEGRYSIGNQANVGLFNLEKLGEALWPVLTPPQQTMAMQLLKEYPRIYHARFHELFKAKLGLLGSQESDGYLIAFLLKLMEDTGADFTMTFRHLSEISARQLQDLAIPQEMWALQDLSAHQFFSEWVSLYLQRLNRQGEDSDAERRSRMKGVNPRYVLRNWMAESAIGKAEKDDFSEVQRLQEVLRLPFQEQERAEGVGYAARPPRWADSLRVSCSS